MALRPNQRLALVAAFVLCLVAVAFLPGVGRVQAPEVAGRPGSTDGRSGAAARAERAPRGVANEVARASPSTDAGTAAPAGVTVEPGPPGGAVEGVVVESGTGRKVAFAELTFQREGGANTVRSDASGAFVFVAPTPASWQLATVSAEGFLPFAPAWGYSPISVGTAAGRVVKGVVIALTRAVEYVATVQDPSGKPAFGAEVFVLGAASGERSLLPLRDSFRTDASGEARFLAPDGAVVEARLPGFTPARASIDLAARVSHRVLLRLGSGGQEKKPSLRIAGRVVRSDNEPVPGALVACTHEGSWTAEPHPWVEVESDSSGRFVCAGLDEGSYAVRARAPLAQAAAAEATAAAGTADLTLTLAAGGHVKGRVTSTRTGAPVPDFTVQAFRQVDSLRKELLAGAAFVDPDGAYDLGAVPFGPARVVVFAPGFAPSDEVAVTVSQDSTAVADVALAEGRTLRGVALDAVARVPLASARITVEGRRSAAAGPSLSQETVADDQGRFSLTGLGQEGVSAMATAEGHHARLFTVHMPEGGGDPPLVTVLLTPLKAGEDPSVELAGIGAVLGAEGEVLVVGRVLDGGGAQSAGIVPGDRIVAVDGRKVTQLGFEGSMFSIRGPEGTFVLLRVRRATGEVEVQVERKLVRG